MRIENENLRQALNEIGIAGIQRVEQNLNIEKTQEGARYQERVVKEKEVETKNCELEELRKELGVIGGAGHYFGNDKGGVRDSMEEKEFKKVLQLLAAGETKINLKFSWSQMLKVAEAGWTIKFNTAFKNYGGDGKFYLWIWNKEGGAKFKAIAQEIDERNGEEANRRELQSKKDGTRQRIKYEDVAGYVYVRFNITIL
ncbi:unnamed protein product [Oikopleura dioica]|uniref:Uncharacterized protein n=1 Tax=Oikopleura dioica TaxID=34765 RepID=E4XXL6_OIKDI|nr:unnamed protein product [Oikopleura dioica]